MKSHFSFFISVFSFAALLASGNASADIHSASLQKDLVGMFQPANVKGTPLAVNLDEAGYVEEEYFISGTASSYNYHNGTLAIHNADLPYTTRVVIRRPADMKQFSGVIHIEPEHPSMGGTLHWLTMKSLILKNHDAFVSVGAGNDPRQRQLTASSQAPTMQSSIAQWFNPERYSALSWPQDDGIRYDVFGQIGQWLQSSHQNNPFVAHRPRAVIAGGWSFTGSFMRTFINYGFHNQFTLATGKPVFDAYLVGISSRWNGLGVLPLNSDVDKAPKTDSIRDLKPVNVPVVEFITEFEVADGDGPQMPDSDAAVGAHRLYEIGAVIHSDQQLLDQGANRYNRPHILQLLQKGYPINQIGNPDEMNGCPYPISNIPHGPYARAALNNIRHWVLEGVPAPHAAELRLDTDGRILRDTYQNPMGGLPLAEFALPLASYHQIDMPACKRNGRPYMVRETLGREELVQLYGSAKEYIERYRAYTNTLVTERWLLAEDAEKLLSDTEEAANAAFTH